MYLFPNDFCYDPSRFGWVVAMLRGGMLKRCVDNEYFDFSVSSHIKTRQDDGTSRKLYYNVFLDDRAGLLQTYEELTRLYNEEIKVKNKCKLYNGGK